MQHRTSWYTNAVYMVHHNDVAMRSFYMAQGYFQAKRNSATIQHQQSMLRINVVIEVNSLCIWILIYFTFVHIGAKSKFSIYNDLYYNQLSIYSLIQNDLLVIGNEYFPDITYFPISLMHPKGTYLTHTPSTNKHFSVFVSAPLNWISQRNCNTECRMTS